MNSSEWHSAGEIARAVACARCSAEEVVRDALDRIHALDGRIHAFLHVDADRAIAAARRVDQARASGETLGLLCGVPIAVKDNLCTTFGRTTCGSRMLEAFQSRYDAHVVQCLERAGAVIVGKTNLDEFAMGSSTEHGAFGPTRNPWDETRVAGGSSGGSAAAVAARFVPAAIGSDTGGSIRLPAAYCGVVGLKPSYGRVSRYGLVAFASSLDQIGPLATTVEDAALILRVIAGHDRRDSTCVNEPTPDYVGALNRPLRGVRIGLCDKHLSAGLDSCVRQAVENAIEKMRAEGAEIVPVELPHTDYAIACYYLIAPAEASSNLARYDGVHYGHRTARPENIFDLYAASRGEGFGPEVKRRIMLGSYALSSGYYDQYYVKALKVRTLIRRDFEKAFERVDAIVSPVAPGTAFRIGEKVDDPLAMYLMDIYTISANLAGTCAISVPCGFDAAGLPIGLQLTAPAMAEENLLAVAHQFQCVTDFHRAVPAMASVV